MPYQVTDHQSTNGCELAEDLVSLVQAANQRNSVLSKLSRAANILRYYRTSQLLQRAWRQFVPTFCVRPGQTLPLLEAQRVRKSSLEKMRGIATTRSVRTLESMQTFCDDLSHGKFTLLAQPCDLGQPCELGMAIDWHGRVASHPSHLWRFQLHYHEYLLDLAIGSAAEKKESFHAWPVIWEIVDDWIDGNPLEQALSGEDAWHPYCISRRLPIWAQLFALNAPPDELGDRFLQSFACQAEVLSKTLEFDLGGNHLLENLTALAIAGAFLENSPSETWLDLATHHLQQQITLQVLPTGEHYERAPMYHCQVLGNLLHVAHVTTGVRNELATLCRQTASKMHSFLQSILHPDGEIPLFGDSCWGEAHRVDDINNLSDLAGLDARSLSQNSEGGVQQPGKLGPSSNLGTCRQVGAAAAPAAVSESGATVTGPYWVWRQADDTLIFDTGPVGASTLPAHAHCDLLGLEASIGGKRWFVDSGLFDYEESAMRDYCRSSAAHNVVTVADQSCCDVWSRFRMGRRGRPTRLEHGRQGGFSWCQAGHDGYRHLGLPEISRLMVVHTSGVWTCLEYASKKIDSPLVGRLHLAPGIELQQLDPQRLLLTTDGIERWLTVTPGVKLGLAKGWYCDRFGRRTRTQVITYHAEASGRAGVRGCDGSTFGWSLFPSAKTTAGATIIDSQSGQVEIAINGSPEVFRQQFPH